MRELNQLQSTRRHGITIIGCLAVVSLFGCAASKPATPQTAKAKEHAATSPSAVQPPAVTQPTQSAPVQKPPAAVEPAAPIANAPAPPKATDTRTSKSEPPATKAPVKPAAPVANATPTAKQLEATIAQNKTPAAQALDLKSLEQRLRDTHAIGTFTKLSLKNQVDDLLDEFRDFYRGKIKTPLSALRQRYDLLLMKVLTLLQDSDTALASAISSSREAIWDILKDPNKFSQI